MVHPLLETHKKDIPQTLDPCLGIFFGKYYTCKTYLLGSMIQAALDAGKSALFLNVQGEDGEKTLLNFPDVKKIVIEAKGYKDIIHIQKELEKTPVDCLGIDSGTVWAYEFQKHFLNNFELPFEGKESSGHWNLLHHHMRQSHTRLRRCATRVFLACHLLGAGDDLDTLRGQRSTEMQIVPSYPGREKTECVGWVDFVGYTEANRRGAETEYKLHFERMGHIITKARLLRPMVKPIRVPEGPGAWASVEEALNRHLTMEGTK